MKQTRKRNSKISREFRLPANVMHEEAWEDSGPNMKLSRAFIVVLALHIVAVAGLAAFNLFDNKKTKDGTTTNLPEKPGMAIVKEQSTTDSSNPTTPAGPFVMESMRAVKVEKPMSTALFALQYGLSEDALLKMNKHTPLVQGPLFTNETVYVPDTAIKRSAIEDLPVAPMVTRPIEAPKPVVSDSTPPVLQPTPPKGTYTSPKPEKVVAKASSKRKPKSKPKATFASSHQVKKGENLYRIAMKYNVSQGALQRANGIADPKKLRIGQRLKIPK